MGIGLYMDHHVRAEITEGLRQRGVDVLTTWEDAHANAADPVVLMRASELGRMLFTQDTDFLSHATERQRKGIHFAGVAYAHQLGITIGQCVDDLELICKACGPAEMHDRIVYLPLK